MTLLALRFPFTIATEARPKLQRKVDGVQDEDKGEDQDSVDKEAVAPPQDLPYPRRMIQSQRRHLLPY
jgi:hypothetical protein